MTTTIRILPTRPLAWSCAFVLGLGFGCQPQTASNPGHCFNAEGDLTCAERFGPEFGYCASPEDGCEGVTNYGCVAEPPSSECYSPCGHGTIAAEDENCLGAADESGSGDGDGDGDGSGDGDGDGDPDPVCGDGQVDADEACDDGNLVNDDDCSNACALPSCGDGIVQATAGEACDDGNTIAGDTCSVGCVLPGTVLWSRNYDVEACAGDLVGVQSNENIVITAYCENGVWRLIAFDPEGEQLWKYGTTVAGTAMDIGLSDQIAVGGQLSASQGQLRYYDSNGNYVWSRNLPADSSVHGVAVDIDDSVIITGAIGIAPNTQELLRRYNAAGAVDWSHEQVGNDLTALAIGSTGSIMALQSNPLRIEFFTSGGVLDATSGVLGSPTESGDLILDAADNSFVVAPNNDGADSFFVAKLGVTGAPVWTTPHVNLDNDEYGVRLVGLPTGGVLVAGSSTPMPGESDGLLSWFSPDGELLQDVTLDGEYDSDYDALFGVATFNDEYGVATGYQISAEAGTTLWLVKFAL